MITRFSVKRLYFKHYAGLCSGYIVRIPPESLAVAMLIQQAARIYGLKCGALIQEYDPPYLEITLFDKQRSMYTAGYVLDEIYSDLLDRQGIVIFEESV